MFFERALSKLSKQILYESPKALYKYLLRECEKLPADAGKFYKHSIKQSFKQHTTEADPERINEIITKSISDMKWITEKYLKK